MFREDLLVCPRCTGRMRVLAAITDPAVVGALLAHLGLPTEPPAVAAARAPPQVPSWPGAVDRAPTATMLLSTGPVMDLAKLYGDLPI